MKMFMNTIVCLFVDVNGECKTIGNGSLQNTQESGKWGEKFSA